MYTHFLSPTLMCPASSAKRRTPPVARHLMRERVAQLIESVCDPHRFHGDDASAGLPAAHLHGELSQPQL